MKEINVQRLKFVSNCPNGPPVPPSTANYLLNSQASSFRLASEFLVLLVRIMKDSDYTSAILTFEAFGKSDDHIRCAVVAATTDQLEYVHGCGTLMRQIAAVKLFSSWPLQKVIMGNSV
jgi:hypothetical protein